MSIPVLNDDEFKEKPFIILHTILSDADLSKFEIHGKCVKWDDKFLNIPIKKLLDELQFKFLFIDITKKNHHEFFNTNLSDANEFFNIVCYCRKYQKHQLKAIFEDVNGLNIIHSIKDQSLPSLFIKSLLEPYLNKLNMVMACLSCISTEFNNLDKSE